jgi:hypothetical protein
VHADFRGVRAFSLYQHMAVAALAFSVVIVFILPVPTAGKADVAKGLPVLLNPAVILALEVSWAAVLFYGGAQFCNGVEGRFLRHKGEHMTDRREGAH